MKRSGFSTSHRNRNVGFEVPAFAGTTVFGLLLGLRLPLVGVHFGSPAPAHPEFIEGRGKIPLTDGYAEVASFDRLRMSGSKSPYTATGEGWDGGEGIWQFVMVVYDMQRDMYYNWDVL